MEKHDVEFWGLIVAIKAIVVGLFFLYAYWVSLSL